jgi:PAS domain-containing protein
VPRLGPDGQILMWVGCNVDIHEQKLMVQELLEAAEQQSALAEQAYQTYQHAQQQRATLYSLFMQAPAQIAVVRGPEFRFEFANPNYLAALGDRELLGRPAAEAVPELVHQGLLPVLEEVYRTGVSFQAREVRHEFDADGSGQLRPAYYTYVIQRFSENGQPAGLSSYAYDVTELVLARRDLEQLRDSATNTLDEAAAS